MSSQVVFVFVNPLELTKKIQVKHRCERLLSQGGHPIAFFNKPFSPKLLCASTYVHELFAVKKWRQYLLCHHFTIITNHHVLKELMTQVVQTSKQQMYLARLMGYDYSIHYRSGKLNMAANALSKLLDPASSSIFLLSVPYLPFLEELKQHLLQDPTFI